MNRLSEETLKTLEKASYKVQSVARNMRPIWWEQERSALKKNDFTTPPSTNTYLRGESEGRQMQYRNKFSWQSSLQKVQPECPSITSKRSQKSRENKKAHEEPVCENKTAPKLAFLDKEEIRRKKKYKKIIVSKDILDSEEYDGAYFKVKVPQSLELQFEVKRLGATKNYSKIIVEIGRLGQQRVNRIEPGFVYRNSFFRKKMYLEASKYIVFVFIQNIKQKSTNLSIIYTIPSNQHQLVSISKASPIQIEWFNREEHNCSIMLQNPAPPLNSSLSQCSIRTQEVRTGEESKIKDGIEKECQTQEAIAASTVQTISVNTEKVSLQQIWTNTNIISSQDVSTNTDSRPFQAEEIIFDAPEPVPFQIKDAPEPVPFQIEDAPEPVPFQNENSLSSAKISEIVRTPNNTESQISIDLPNDEVSSDEDFLPDIQEFRIQTASICKIPHNSINVEDNKRNNSRFYKKRKALNTSDSSEQVTIERVVRIAKLKEISVGDQYLDEQELEQVPIGGKRSESVGFDYLQLKGLNKVSTAESTTLGQTG